MASNLTEKRRIERRYLDLVRFGVAGFPSGEPDPDHTDKPDFVFRTQNCRLGIEVTRLFTDPLLKGQEAERQAIVNISKEISEGEGLPPIKVTVNFAASPALQKSDRGALSGPISKYVRENIPEYGCFSTIWCNDIDEFELPEAIDSILIARLPGLTRQYWSYNRAGYIDDDFARLLQSEITQKDRRLPDYESRCDRCWLIIAADGDNPSSFFQFSERMKSERFESAFERAFFVDGFTGKVFELQLASSGN